LLFFCKCKVIFIIFAQSQNQTNSINYAEQRTYPF
jgi:hypothetical protein